MRNIKLAVLALALVCGFVGAYGKYKKMSQIYYIYPNTPVDETHFRVAATSPSVSCSAGTENLVCTVSAEEGLPTGYYIPSQDATILYTYEN